LHRWIYIGVGDVLIEGALVVTSVGIVARRQMPLSSKLTVVGAFSSRVLYANPPLSPPVPKHQLTHITATLPLQ
jgi:hypothetical protein